MGNKAMRSFFDFPLEPPQKGNRVPCRKKTGKNTIFLETVSTEAPNQPARHVHPASVVSGRGLDGAADREQGLLLGAGGLAKNKMPQIIFFLNVNKIY